MFDESDKPFTRKHIMTKKFFVHFSGIADARVKIDADIDGDDYEPVITAAYDEVPTSLCIHCGSNSASFTSPSTMDREWPEQMEPTRSPTPTVKPSGQPDELEQVRRQTVKAQQELEELNTKISAAKHELERLGTTGA